MLFDIYVTDRLDEAPMIGDEIESTTKLTADEVMQWLAKASWWNFEVVEHGNPKSSFMVGSVYKEMKE